MAVAPTRNGSLDIARGIAVIAMVVYHLVWDLAFFGVIDPATATAPGFRRLGATIAGAFLLISGIALVLARQAATNDSAFRARYVRRLAIIVGAAALVSLGTWFAMGDRFVRFGILHCIALSSLLALPFLRLPFWAALMAGVATLVLPWLIDSPTFAQTPLIWLGLSSQTPAMVDYVPVFPFAGMTLLGVAAGLRLQDQGSPEVGPGGGSGWLARLGRWSLPIYLVHQPLLYGALFILASSLAPTLRSDQTPVVDRDTAGFRTECRRSCEAQNTKAHCESYCTCAETDMKASDLWRRAMTSRNMEALQTELQPLLQACTAKAQGTR
jgi:uncharacterized membrane protein